MRLYRVQSNKRIGSYKDCKVLAYSSYHPSNEDKLNGILDDIRTDGYCAYANNVYILDLDYDMKVMYDWNYDYYKSISDYINLVKETIREDKLNLILK